jgi:hypothetical protein
MYHRYVLWILIYTNVLLASPRSKLKEQIKYIFNMNGPQTVTHIEEFFLAPLLEYFVVVKH